MSSAAVLPESMVPVAPAGEPASASSGVFGRLAGHQAALDAFLREQLADFEPEIRDLAAYALEASGKRLRPALVFLSGWKGSGAPSAELVRVAAVVEMVHLATLVHDDIMDGAEVRRNRPTVARRYGSAAAVLLGDALFAHALHLTTQFPTTAVCAAVSVAMRRVCAGEIVQTLRRGSLRVDRADYTRIVDLKTAELFRVSCQLGAEVAGHPAGFVAAASRFGRHLGIGYQIYDDLVDFFGEEARIGKTLGTDLTSGKLTLPLLVLRERLEPVEQERRRRQRGEGPQRGGCGFDFAADGVRDRLEDAELGHLAEAQGELGRALAGDLPAQRGGFVGREPVDEVEEREGQFAAGQIGAEGLADAGFVAEEIHEVVVNLIRDAEMAAEAAGRLDVVGIEAREARAEEAGNPEELGGLQVDDALVIGTADVGRTAAQRLDDLAGADPPRGIRDGGADFVGRKLGREMERVGEQRVPEQHGRGGTVFARRGPAAAPHVGLVHDIVVDQRREVHELDDRGDADEVGRDHARPAPTAEEDQGGPDALARGVDAIVRHGADLRLEGGQLAVEEAIQLGHVRAEQPEQLGEGVRFAGTGRSSEVRVNRTGGAAHGMPDARCETRNDQPIVAA